jgi:hypothetical protein
MIESPNFLQLTCENFALDVLTVELLNRNTQRENRESRKKNIKINVAEVNEKRFDERLRVEHVAGGL